MKSITLDNESIFSISATDLMGNTIPDKIIRSVDFMMFESKKLAAVKDQQNFEKYLWEYSAILKAIVKNEMLFEMQQRIENIDTFYN